MAKQLLGRFGLPTIVAWGIVGALGLAMLVQVATFDFRDRQLAGDQASFVLQALSLAHEGNLSYGQSDIELWRDLGWEKAADHPYGLHLRQNQNGWAFAKPYGHSLLAAPFVRVAGAGPGFALVNALLVAALFVLVVLILRFRFSGPVVPVTAFAFVGASHVRFWAFPISTDVFLAVVVAVVTYAALRALRDRSWAWSLVATVVMVFAVSEKVTLVLALLPLVALAAWKTSSRRQAAALVGAGLAAGLIFVFPYLHYSDWTSWTAYGGDRYVLTGPAPFETGVASNPVPAGTSEPFSPGFVLSQTLGVGTDTVHAAMTYAIGRHTGLVPFMPIALVALALAGWHFRSSDRGPTIAIFAGLSAYIGLYLVVLTDNYFGGGQSIGNRYFMQVAPMVVGLLGVSRIPIRHLAAGAYLSIVVTLLLVPHHHRHAERAFWNITEVGEMQELLPFESSQRHAGFLGGGS